MKLRLLIILFSLWGLYSCSSDSDRILYTSDEFTLRASSLEQGKYLAKALSADELQSDYVSTAHLIYPRMLEFKFSINEKDNELPFGMNHRVFLSDEQNAIDLVFGKPSTDDALMESENRFLPTNFKLRVNLDMSPVFDAFDKQGYYEATDGSRIAAVDFRSICIAGSSLPLSWDWVNLEEKNLSLKPAGSRHLYTIDLILNPFDENQSEVKTWKRTADISAKPQYSSEQLLVDALYRMSLEEAQLAIEADSTLRTGAKWGGVWTRDVSYSTLLQFAMLEPEVAKISLMKKVFRDRIIQDTGSGGAWPVSSDRTTWVLAAWEIYKYTGDEAWLKTIYPIIKNTLEDDYLNLYNPKTGLFKGESSFLDWREQSYPRWMNNADIYQSENLATNAVHYQAHQILAEIADLLGETAFVYRDRATAIKNGINTYLWNEQRGYYNQYLYGRGFLIPSERFETLGESLCILFDIADSAQAASIVKNAPLTAYGSSCFYPQIPNIPPYHNNAVWPFVQAFWNLAAAKVGNEAVLNHGMASIFRAASLFLTNYENMVADHGDYQGTEINSHRMLWSMAGNMAMVNRVLMGIQFESGGIYFKPVVPEAYQGVRELRNFPYRNSKLNIRLEGWGNQIKSFRVNGKKLDIPFISCDLIGDVSVEIQLDNQALPSHEMNRVANHTTVSEPAVRFTKGFDAQNPEVKGLISWNKIPEAVSYRVFLNGSMISEQTDTAYFLYQNKPAELSVSAIDQEGFTSFISEPLNAFATEWEVIREAEEGYIKSPFEAINFSGEGFMRISKDENQKLSFTISLRDTGIYRLDFRYANGTGPWNTDNNCCVRSLYLNGILQGTMVMPQRGTNEWSDWGFSNSRILVIPAGKNYISLDFEPWNINMDGEINEALIDYVRLSALSNAP